MPYWVTFIDDDLVLLVPAHQLAVQDRLLHVRLQQRMQLRCQQTSRWRPAEIAREVKPVPGRTQQYHRLYPGGKRLDQSDRDLTRIRAV